MKARNIGENLRLLFGIIDHANHEKIPGAVLLDLHKAFDSLNWSFIFAILKYYGLIKWIRVLYKNPKCHVVNNNFLTSFFDVKKGVRQEALFSTIFILSIAY